MSEKKVTSMDLIKSAVSSPDDNETIFMEIPAYKDPDLLNTINSALVQADHPERIHFGVCYQSDDMETLEKLKTIPNLRYKHVPLAEAKGSCYARNLCQHMLEDETYIFQIDSHLRFCKHWDTLMIRDWKSFKDPKAWISAYLVNLDEDMVTKPLDDPLYDNPLPSYVVSPYRFRFAYDDNIFHNDHMLTMTMHEVGPDDCRVGNPAMLCAAHYVFGPASMDREVYFDTDMYFYGDETPMAIRRFTYGYRVYVPPYTYARHAYIRATRSFPEDAESIRKRNAEAIRFQTLVGTARKPVDLGEFGLGNVYTLDELEKFTGVYFRKHIIYNSAVEGYFGEVRDKYYDDKNAHTSPIVNHDFDRWDKIRDGKLHVIVEDLQGKGQLFVQQAMQHAYNSDRLDFIVASPYDYTVSNAVTVCTGNLQTFGNCYSMGFAKLLESKPDKSEPVLFIDSGSFFCRDWDLHFLKYLSDQNETSVITCTSLWLTKPDNFNSIGRSTTDVLWRPRDCINNKVYSDGVKFAVDAADYIPPCQYLAGSILCGRISTIEKVPFDTTLDFADFIFTYSARLFTNGIDIYLMSKTYAYRLDDVYEVYKAYPSVYKDNINVGNIVGVLFNKCYDYEYGLGTARNINSWLSLNNINYSIPSRTLFTVETFKRFPIIQDNYEK